MNPEETPPAMQEAKDMLDNFYKKQKEKWANSEYTKEDITKNFSEEHLASLSIEDYTLLLKRFPQEMVVHVTRQGIRDHVGHIYHTAGEGAYADGFTKMIEDGRLRSPLSVYLVEDEKEKAIARFLNLDNLNTKEEALDRLATFTTNERQGEAGSYVDRMAVHFATEEVADCYYGSEQGNEIFIAYPSAYIASQYYFNGELIQSGGGYWNDLWVWANEEKGMDLNAGLVFIPEEAKVDKKTGSRYELDESGNPKKNSNYKEAFKRLLDSPNFYDFANQVMEITGTADEATLRKLEPFRQKLVQEFNITDGRLQMAILDYHHLRNLVNQKKNEEEGSADSFYSVDSLIEKAMKDKGILYVEAKEVVSSKEFWETHFAKNPQRRPSKVVYYKDQDPTRALYKWRRDQGICKNAKDNDIGFSERNIERSAPQAIAGLDRFKILAEKIIEDYYSDKTHN